MRPRPDLASLYRQMCLLREVEAASARLWRDGLISGELHLGTGEEAAVAGVLAHLRDGDALAVDHRSTPPFVARGVSIEAIVREMLGDRLGLDGGKAGHMHLMSRQHLAAASGIVGASASLACGFGLAAQQAGDGAVAVAFFGDGALNQGLLMEGFNLAAVWKLPVLFVCKDNGWAITTRSRTVTGASPQERARGLGVPARSVDGADVVAVWRAARQAVRRARAGRGPTLLVARVPRCDGHFLDDPLIKVATERRAFAAELGPLTRALRAGGGASVRERAHALSGLTATIAAAARPPGDPLPRARRRLAADVAARIDDECRAEVAAAVTAAVDAARAQGVGAHA